MNFINLTGTQITETITGRVFLSDGLAKIEIKEENQYEIDNIPIGYCCSTRAKGIPPRKEGITYIVTKEVADYFNDSGDAGRRDFIYPGHLRKDDQGNVTGCCGFRTAISIDDRQNLWFGSLVSAGPGLEVPEGTQGCVLDIGRDFKVSFSMPNGERNNLYCLPREVIKKLK